MSYGHRPRTYAIVEKAPFSADKVKELNKYQESLEPNEKSVYLCPHHGKDKQVKLKAMSTGLVCTETGCSYKQDWCYGEILTI